MSALRIFKEGVEWFPFPTLHGTAYELIEAEYGLNGFAVVVKLLQQIYGEHGYYCECKYEVALLFAKKIGLGINVVSEIIAAAVRRGIFDRNMYEKYCILTSKEIQERYFQAISRRVQIEVEERYLLVPIPPNAVSACRQNGAASEKEGSASEMQHSIAEHSIAKHSNSNSSSPRKGDSKKPPKPSAFHNFEERTLDLDALSKKIMEKRVDGG